MLFSTTEQQLNHTLSVSSVHLQPLLLHQLDLFLPTGVIFMVCLCQFGAALTILVQISWRGRWSNWCWSTQRDHPSSLYSVRWLEQLMLVKLEGPHLKSLLCEMAGATDAGQTRGTTPQVFTLWDGWSNRCWSTQRDHPSSLYSVRWLEQLMLVNLEGSPLKYFDLFPALQRHFCVK